MFGESVVRPDKECTMSVSEVCWPLFLPESIVRDLKQNGHYLQGPACVAVKGCTKNASALLQMGNKMVASIDAKQGYL